MKLNQWLKRNKYIVDQVTKSDKIMNNFINEGTL